MTDAGVKGDDITGHHIPFPSHIQEIRIMSINKLNNLISSLKRLEKNPDNHSYFEDFENIISQIGVLNDSKSISLLVPFLDDESKEHNLMNSIIHTIEIFDDDVYIEEILKICPYLYKHSPGWTSIIFMRILNSEKCKTELIKQLRKSSSIVKESVKSIMEEINKASPEFLAKTVPVTATTLI